MDRNSSGGFLLDDGRQLSISQPINSGGGSRDNGGSGCGDFSLDSGSKLGASRPISGGGTVGDGKGGWFGVEKVRFRD